MSIAESPSETDRKSGTTKKTPDWMKYWKKNIRRPPTSWTLPQDRRAHERLGAALLEPRLPREEQPEQEQAAEDEPQRRGDAEQLRRVRLRRTQPHTLERRTPKTASPSPAARQHDADEVDPGSLPGRLVRDPPGQHEDRRARSAPRRRTRSRQLR